MSLNKSPRLPSSLEKPTSPSPLSLRGPLERRHCLSVSPVFGKSGRTYSLAFHLWIIPVTPIVNQHLIFSDSMPTESPLVPLRNRLIQRIILVGGIYAQEPRNQLPDPRQELVEKGDFLQLLNLMLERSVSLPCPDNDLKRVARAIRNKAVADPNKLTEDALTSAITFASYMLCRVEYTVFRKIQEHDQRHQNMPLALPPDVAQEWLPRAERLVRLILRLSHTGPALGVGGH